MRKFTSVLAAAGFAMLPLASQAASSSVPTLGDVLKASGISANGYIDFGTTYNNAGLNGLNGIGGLAGANNLSFRLNQVGLAVTTALSDHFSGTLDLLAGQDAAAVASDQAGDIELKQAYVQYTDGGLTVMGGRFVTLAGSEVINSSQNQNATRSLLFTQLQPLTHTGVRASYAINKMISVTGGFSNSALPNNGAAPAGVINDNNKQKTLELQVAVTPFDGFNNALTFYRGAENVGRPDGQPFLVDLVSSMQVTKALSLGLNYDFRALMNTAGAGGNDRRDHGVALYGRYQLCNNLGLGGRAEFLESSYNAQNRTTQYEYTVTADYAMSKNFSVLTDVRYDMNAGRLNGASGALLAGNGGLGTTAGIDVMSLTVKGIYRF